VNIIIGSDVVPTHANIHLFNKGEIKSILDNKLINIWNSADERIFNLEVPLSNEKNPIHKQGPNLIAPTSTVKGIKALNPSIITLANNHILDHEDQGLNTTQELLDSNNIPYIGAGKNLAVASKPYILNKNGLKIGIYTCAEHEFTIATENTAGANPFDPLESLDHIADLNKKCDYVIVLYHGGKEHYRYPSPYLQKVCRKIVEKGADLVVCQHSHCVGSFEEYNNSTIVYGQGNFIFNKRDNEYWNTSLLIDVQIKHEININYIPIFRTKKGVALATENKADEILNSFYKRSLNITEKGFIEKEYQKFAKNYLKNYMRKLAGFGKWKSRIDNRIFKGTLSKRAYSEQERLAIRNYIECESHRELLLEGLKRGNSSER